MIAQISRWIPPRRVVVWSTVAALPMSTLVGLGGYLSYRSHHLLRDSRYQVEHAYEVLDSLDRLFISLQDAETGELGYIITGTPAYLATYNIAQRSVRERYGRLRSVAAGDAPLMHEVQELEAPLTAKLAQLSHVLTTRQERGWDEAVAEVAGTEAKRLMDAVREKVNRISLAEQANLRQTQLAAERRERQVLTMAATIAALSIALRAGIAWALRRARKPRQTA